MQKPPDGLIAVVKRDCPTCVLVAPVLRQIAGAAPLCILSQDDPDFPEGLAVTDERDLEQSFHLGIEIVPTLIRMQNGVADQQSRDPHSLARSFAGSLRVVAHPKLVIAAEAFLVVWPEHARVFREAGWSKARLKEELHGLLQIPATEILRDGCAL